MTTTHPHPERWIALDPETEEAAFIYDSGDTIFRWSLTEDTNGNEMKLIQLTNDRWVCMDISQWANVPTCRVALTRRGALSLLGQHGFSPPPDVDL